jgi:hypothetical protein
MKEKEISVSKFEESRRERERETHRKKSSVIRKLNRPVGGNSRREQFERSVRGGVNLGSNKNSELLAGNES